MRYTLAFLVLPFLLLAACATDLVEEREGWYGASFEEVRAAWGPPTSSSKEDGADVYVWNTEVPSSSGTSVGVGVGIFRGGSVGVGVGTGVSVPIGAPPPPHRCERKMIFRDGKVFDQIWSGDPYYCQGFKRPG
jgi:hypothetical protein